MTENEKLWQAVAGLHKANDWHLTLCLAIVEGLKAKGLLSDDEVHGFIKDAAVEVAKKKFALQVQMESALKAQEPINMDKYM